MTRRRTLDALAGRAVWCADPQLRGYLRWAGEGGVTAFALEMPEHYESADVVVPRVRAADIVVLNAPPSHALARAIRDRGARGRWWPRDDRSRRPVPVGDVRLNRLLDVLLNRLGPR